ncbi:SDR family oxidoreductase [Clostridium sp. AN503]|uniref:SDR family NAD(P)-dependent oxidoreductase n=1 Tax=Clostridium sp. AN503 TaxID=3160598 RepID=UPI00345B26F4
MDRKTALITGAAKGIGRQIALELAKAGYNIVVNYRSDRLAADEVCRQAEAWGARALPIYADISVVEDIRKMYREAIGAFDHLDVVVNNAGISSEVYFLEATEEMFDRMTAIDWKGLYFSSQIAALHMVEKGIRGVIVNVSSNQVDGSWPRATIYGPTKAAVSKFTKNAAMELSQKGIRMVAVAPGYTDVGWEPGDIRLEAAARLPFKRFATTTEIARGVVYLASEDADYITGTTLTIDGGATLPVVAANDFV